jgi:hypothetical protein
MNAVRRRATALLVSAFAATAVLGLAASPAQAVAAPGAETSSQASQASSGLLGSLFGNGGLLTVFIGNYQVNN